MKKVLITGAAGFLGSHLCDRFISEGCKVIGMDNLITGDLKNIEHLFKDANFEEIISKLSRWYGVEIDVENFDNSEWAYSGEFQNEYLSNVLESMSFSKEFEYKLDQNKVFIKF